EDLRHRLLCHAEAVIPDRDDGVVPIAPRPEIDAPALLLELGSVVQEVGHDLGKPSRVGVDHDRRLGETDVELVAAGIDDRLAWFARRPHRWFMIHPFRAGVYRCLW